MTNIVHSDKLTAYELSVPAQTAHGTDGHAGYRCYQCAMESGVTVQLADSGGEYWQNKQLDWQEKCDTLQNKFDLDVATHWPNHQPMNCTTCPVRMKPASPFGVPL